MHASNPEVNRPQLWLPSLNDDKDHEILINHKNPYFSGGHNHIFQAQIHMQKNQKSLAREKQTLGFFTSYWFTKHQIQTVED